MRFWGNIQNRCLPIFLWRFVKRKIGSLFNIQTTFRFIISSVILLPVSKVSQVTWTLNWFRITFPTRPVTKTWGFSFVFLPNRRRLLSMVRRMVWKKGQVNDALKELDYIEENVFKNYIVRSLEVVEKISYPIAWRSEPPFDLQSLVVVNQLTGTCFVDKFVFNPYLRYRMIVASRSEPKDKIVVAEANHSFEWS